MAISVILSTATSTSSPTTFAACILRAVKIPDFDPCSKKAKALAEEYDAALRFLLGDKANDYLKDIGV